MGRKIRGFPRGKKPRVSYPFVCRQNSANLFRGFGSAQDPSPDRRRVIFALFYAKRTLLVSDLSLSKDVRRMAVRKSPTASYTARPRCSALPRKSKTMSGNKSKFI
jgi:hypothetical protein